MRGLARFGVENPVMIGIAMALILGGGLYSSLSLIREMFPESRPNQIMITAPYPGATPLEVERGLALRIEEAIKSLDHIDKIVTQINEGSATVVVELSSEEDNLDQAVNDFKAAIDSIPRDELPELAEEIRVQQSEPKLPVIAVTAFGDLDEYGLKQIGEMLREDLLRLPEVSDLVISGTRKAELAVEVSPEKLVEYGVSLNEVAQSIRQTNLDLPGGQVKTSAQNVAVRTLGETDNAARIADTVVRTVSNGQIVRVRDLGRVLDHFEDSDTAGQFNGKPAVTAMIYKTSEQDAIDISSVVQAYVAGKRDDPLETDWTTQAQNALGIETIQQKIYNEARRQPFGDNVTVMTHSNLSRFIESRLELLTRNGFWGLIFVFLTLLMFLNWRVALWVMTGLVISVSGSIILMNTIGASLNLISMFGLIVVLGLIVDDAIIVGENIYARVERGEDPVEAAIKGAEEVTWPVVVAVCTTIGAFLPLLFIEGRIGDFMGVLPVVVICALSVSLFESLSILPSHLAKWIKPQAAPKQNENGHTESNNRLLNLLRQRYASLLRVAAQYRYVTVTAVFSVFLVSLGMVMGERVPFVFLQKMDAETLLCDIDMPVGTPAARTKQAMRVIEDACLEVDEIDSIWALVGSQIDADEGGAYTDARSHLAQVIIELKPVEQRTRASEEIINGLRRKTSNIPGVNAISFRSMQGGPAGAEIAIEVTGKNIDHLVAVADDLKERLAEYAGVFDIADDYDVGRRELQIELLESARPLGLTTEALASEIRGAFYGIEARTIQRGREDVDIRVRFPRAMRTSIYELETMRIATPTGQMVPFQEVARVTESRGAAAIRRVDQRRAIVVEADVDHKVANPDQIIAQLTPSFADYQSRYPGVSMRLAGNKEETRKSFGSLQRDFVIAIVLIYCMLAALFKSYIQPLIVLTAVPFGLNGAVFGHFAMGYPLTILSMIGLVALTGIVVNDSLIMVTFINQELNAGRDRIEAVVLGGVRRLRPIILTSLTTILGLAPLMAETSFQARFLIPMAISISFGLAFATVLTLIVVPANYLIVEDIKDVISKITGKKRSRPELVMAHR